jgi:hypothetical protein
MQPMQIRASIIKIGTKMISHDVVISNCSLCAIRISNVNRGVTRNTKIPSATKNTIKSQKIGRQIIGRKTAQKR